MSKYWDTSGPPPPAAQAALLAAGAAEGVSVGPELEQSRFGPGLYQFYRWRRDNSGSGTTLPAWVFDDPEALRAFLRPWGPRWPVQTLRAGEREAPGSAEHLAQLRAAAARLGVTLVEREWGRRQRLWLRYDIGGDADYSVEWGGRRLVTSVALISFESAELLDGQMRVWVPR